MPSSDLQRHARFMALALEAGRRALPKCLPNPPVGCVLVRGEEVIATGYTMAPGEFHAEAGALSRLTGDPGDVVAYVTLEPCSFRGRTPSCAKALVESGIREVHAAILDPDPRNNGKGMAILQEGGITTTCGLLEAEALHDLGPYLYRAIDRRPNQESAIIGQMLQAGYSGTPLPKKLGIKPGGLVRLIGAPEGAAGWLAGDIAFSWALPEDVADVIVLFCEWQNDLIAALPSAIAGLRKNGGLWIAWPKKASKVPTDITEDVLRDVILPMGLVDNKVCAVTEVWSGLRFVWRIENR